MWQRCSLTDMLHALLSTVLVFAFTIWRLRRPWSSGRAVILATCLELALFFDAYARAPGAMLSSRGPMAGSQLLDSSAHPRAPPDVTFSPLIGSKLCAVPSCSSTQLYPSTRLGTWTVHRIHAIFIHGRGEDALDLAAGGYVLIIYHPGFIFMSHLGLHSVKKEETLLGRLLGCFWLIFCYFFSKSNEYQFSSFENY